MAYSAWVWAISLTARAGRDPDELAAHFVEGCAPELRRVFEAIGVRTTEVERYDPAHPPSNKLAQLSSPLLGSADFYVLCDCDLAFAADPRPWLGGGDVRAKVVDFAVYDTERWRVILDAAGFGMPAESVRTLDGSATIPTYCNGGLLLIPKRSFELLAEAWPRWNQWVKEHTHLLGGNAYYIDQVSFTLACLDGGLEIDLLPAALNLPTHLSGEPLAQLEGVDPVVLHFHKHLDRDGRLLPTGVESIDRRIAEVNELIAARVGELDPALLAGVGGPGAVDGAKRKVLAGARRLRATLGR